MFCDSRMQILVIRVCNAGEGDKLGTGKEDNRLGNK